MLMCNCVLVLSPAVHFRKGSLFTHARAQMPLIVVAKLLAARMCCKEWRFVLHRSAPGAMHHAQLQIEAKRGQKMRFQ